MSQVSSTSGVTNTASNSNNNNSTWNRTPGKPGLGGGGGSAVGSNTTSNINSSINHLSLAVRANPSAVVCGSGFSTFDQCDSTNTVPKTSIACSALAYGDGTFREHCSTTSVAGCGVGTLSDRTDFAAPPIGAGLSEPSQMWPPPIFDATENHANTNSNNNNTHTSASSFASHPDLVGSGSGQWSMPSRTNSLFTDTGQANVVSGVWSMDASNVVNTSGAPPSIPVPRAITGQLRQSADSLVGQPGRSGGYAPDATASQQSTAAGGWSTANLNESSHLFTSDQSTLSSAFSKLNMANSSVQSDCFQPIHDYSDDHQLLSTTITNPGDSLLHLGSIGSKGCDKKSSIDGTEVDTLFSPDPEDAIHAIVNTTEAWGTNPIDQSSPWDLSDLGGNGNGSGSTDQSGTQQSLTCSPPPSGGNGDALSRNLFESQSNPAAGSATSMLHQRRITAGSLSGSSSHGDYESNVWPREPPNGTGIWEAHYESLGERTARWQPSSSANQPQQPVPGHLASVVGTNRSHLTGGTSPSEAYRGYAIRPNAGISPLGHPLSAASGSANRPVVGSGGSAGMAQLHSDSLHANGPSRNFPMSNSPVMGSSNTAWLRNNPGSGESVTGDPKVGRWPGNSNLGRLSNKQQQQQPQQHSFQTMLSGPGGASGGNPRWSGGWPPTDPRRGASNVLPLRWSSTGGTGNNDNILPGWGYYGVPSALHPLLPSPSMPPPPPRGFRPPYLPGQQQNALFIPTAGAIGSQSSSQRAGLLSTQQHQLQQQSVLRANAMRQLIGMGFSEDEVQAIFSDLNTNVARALLDLRERTCHSGLDDVIRMFTNVNNSSHGFAPISSVDELGELPGSMRPISARSGFNMSDQQHHQPSKANYMMAAGLPPENVEASLAMLQQRETQILQTIMQLHAKHQELKMVQLRQPNFQFASGVNQVMQELQLQAVQIAQQIEAQQAQLKHVRSQAGMLKQLTIASPSPPPSQTAGVGGNPFTSLPPPGGQPWLPNACLGTGPHSAFVGNSATGMDLSSVGGGGAPMTDLQQQQLLQQMTIEAAGAGAFQDHQHHQQPGGGGAGLKMGSGSFLWESGPWSGPGQPNSQDGYSSLGGGPMSTNAGAMANDRRSWASTNRPQMTGVGFPSTLVSDPRWIMEPPGGGACGAIPDDDYFSNAVVSGGGARNWLLVHNIPPHMSVSVLKTAVASVLAKSSIGGAQLDFELHPNMLARWVLLGMNTAANANLVLEYIDAPGGGHYGCVKVISPMEAFQCLQDIQSLACPFKIPTGNASTTAATVSGSNFLRSGSVQHQLQSCSQIPFSVGGGGGGTDFSVADNPPGLFGTSSVCEPGGASISG